MEEQNENEEAYSGSLHSESLTCDCPECQGKQKYVQIIDVDRYLETLNGWIEISNILKKMRFMKIYCLFLLTFILACSCSRTSSNDATDSKISEQSESLPIDLKGQWYIENIVFNDSTNVRPEEEVPASKQYITFEAETYSIITNCNSISGTYSIEGDSIHIGDGAMTEMACDNMATEDALRKMLPGIATIDVTNDSIVRLNCTDASSYIILRKSPVQVKCHVE